MDEYIKKNDVLKMIEDIKRDTDSSFVYQAAESWRKVIENMPTMSISLDDGKQAILDDLFFQV